VFFNNPQARMRWRPLRFLWEAYGFITGAVSDGLSYLRLFALGLAGSLLGHAFNDIAVMIFEIEGVAGWARPLLVAGGVVVIVGGHALNFALSALGAYVHSVRLMFVEFYRNLDFAGGGKPYKALSDAKPGG
jgi:V/A-type H+-transporting ATPase subunit I